MCHKCNRVTNFYPFGQKVYLLSSITYISYRKERDSFTNHATDMDSLSLYWTVKMKGYIKPKVIYCIHAWLFATCFKGSQCAVLFLQVISQIADGAAVFQHLQA